MSRKKKKIIVKKKKKKEKQLPPCGLYRTGIVLPAEEDGDEVPAGHLIMFHNHSNRNIPFLQMPKENINNVWSFHEMGPGIENDEFIEAMIPLRDQGLYYLNQDLQTSSDDAWYSELTLVQLGYNLKAEPILFMAEPLEEQNGFFFHDEGYGFPDLDILKILSPQQPFGAAEEDDEDEDEEDFDDDEFSSDDEFLN